MRISNPGFGLGPALLGACVLVALSACGGGGGSGNGAAATAALAAAANAAPAGAAAAAPPPPAPDAGPAVATVACADLAGLKIAKSEIGLATTGAVITAARTVAANGAGSNAVGDYCLASGEILPMDPTAPSIRFQVALPKAWNTKVLMRGGGGWNGSIPAIAGNILNSTALSPLARGYAVFGSDSGHQSAASIDASFAANPEAFKNWVGDALKKTRDVAMIVVKASYGKAPVKSYFVGSSTGGREALAVAGRWPADWDGVVALYPSHDAAVQILGMLAETRALAAPGAYLNKPKRDVLYNAALAACDALDGAVDGVISNVEACNRGFDPSTAVLNGIPVRCAGGADTGNSCLSDAQIEALRKINSPVPFNFTLANGETNFPGYNVLISDNGITSTSPLSPTIDSLGFGSVAPAFPITSSMLAAIQYADGFVRYAVARDAGFNSLSVDPSNPGALASGFSNFSALDNGDRDLNQFASRGGKLLIMHGTADPLVSPRRSELYVQQLKAVMGAAKVDGFLRFYEVPGFGHSVSTQFNASWDQLTALENWSEQGVDPALNQTVTDTVGAPGRTRPLCLYPSWPKYKGSGDVNSASSFACATS